MSYIDTFDHEFVGFFGRFPIYHPLEVVEEGGDEGDFACTPGQLVIGGGSGEHPGVVLKGPDNAVAHFLITWLDWFEGTYPDQFKEQGATFEAWDALLRDETDKPWSDVLEFAGWNVTTYAMFHDHCTSQAFRRPFRPSEGQSFEAWFVASLGEFVWFSMPELAATTLGRLGTLKDVLICPLYENVVLRAPGYPATFGRKMVGECLRWGYSAWRIERNRGDGR